MRELPGKKYYKFNYDIKFLKDLYETEKKFRGKHFKRSKSEKTLKQKHRYDYRDTFLNVPGMKDLLKEINAMEREEKKQKGKELPEESEYKNLRKISTSEITQRVCNRYYKRRFEEKDTFGFPLYGWVYSETVGWTKPQLLPSRQKRKTTEGKL